MNILVFPLVTFSKHSNRKNTDHTANCQFLRSVVFSTLVSTVLSLSSCTKSDTIVPDALLCIDGFEDNSFASFWREELWTQTAGYITTEQKRVGKQAMRISWKPSQTNGTNQMLHSELGTAPLPVGETERWYGYSSYMPSSSMANDNQTVIVSQWHGVPDEGGAQTVPVIALSIESDSTLQLVYRASNKPITTVLQHPTSQKILGLGRVAFDQWVDYVVHVNYSPIGTTGQLQIWQDGVLIVNEQGISIGYTEQYKPYWKCGLYCWTGKSKYVEKVIYYDEVRIGGSIAGYDAVKPGRGNNTAIEQQPLINK